MAGLIYCLVFGTSVRQWDVLVTATFWPLSTGWGNKLGGLADCDVVFSNFIFHCSQLAAHISTSSSTPKILWSRFFSMYCCQGAFVAASKNFSSNFRDKSTFLTSTKDVSQDLQSKRWWKLCNSYIYGLLRLCRTPSFLLPLDKRNGIGEVNCFLRKVVIENGILLCRVTWRGLVKDFISTKSYDEYLY